MSLASDLMGLGVSPLLAAHTSSGGVGPVTVVATAGATTYASALKIGATQYLVTASPGSVGTLGLPTIGGDTGALLADDYIVNNQGAATLLVKVSTSVLISVNGILSSIASIVTHTSTTFYSVLVPTGAGSATANWIGVSGT